ncbi:ATP-grasp domain-containing protein [Streptomyces sp. NBC_00237]|uniref:ATP-grasp domain-containing protein n=1 Tax=Streptomyces sp. NBC_00237 TaxID=2975687 RepID=UPI002259D9E1|nr:ATP-grasp domain-containing protein [Streptomyces sp. NBC_00237]MCX5206959.1 ATP-grasp domain-containing protein [Streptomyces sp. NBC_00237]
MKAGWLVCGDPLSGRRVDPAFAGEAAAVRQAGGAVSLLDHDALLAGDVGAALARVPRGSGPYWYRGWMIPVRRYEEVARGMEERGCSLLTGADAYRTAHELPGWYGEFTALTPRSVWRECPPGGPPRGAGLDALVRPLRDGPAVVKDFVKSRKHEWHEACFVPELRDTAALSAVVDRFFALQEDSLAGGLVVREFEHFVPGGEARVWWVDGEAVLVTAHPDSPEDAPEPDLAAVRPAVRALGCRWVTTDLALRGDGEWRVVEVGDGQVSGLPEGADARVLFEALGAAVSSGGSHPPSR